MDQLDLSPEWNAACVRVEDYLRAHRVSSRPHLLRLTLDLISTAQAEHHSDSVETPTQTALRIATSQTEQWFSVLAGSERPDDTTAASRGRMAYFVTDCDRRWPTAFLNPSPPVKMIESVRAASIQAGPALEFRSLVRKEIDYGPMEDIARETWDQFSWGHVLRAFAIWVVIFFVAYGIWLRFFQ
ncbi:MAG: hypothetical protein ACOYNN_00660 [Terrimicrobiaceae bacterium]